MKSFGQKAWVLPQPVLIIGTYNSDGTPNAMNACSINSMEYTCLGCLIFASDSICCTMVRRSTYHT